MRILIAYVPVVHSGYVSFFEQYANDVSQVYIFGEEIILQFPILKKDIRRLHPTLVKKAIDSIGIFPFLTSILEISEIQKIKAELVMPDDDVSRELIAMYFQGFSVEYYPVFLRWDKTRAIQQIEVEPYIVSSFAIDCDFMDIAYQCAKKSSDQWRRVGAVLVKNGQLLYSTYNTHLPTPYTPYIDGDPRGNFKKGGDIEMTTAVHCEMQVVAWAARRGISLFGTSLYVTTFPCPWCAKHIALSGISELFYSEGYAMLDGESVLRGANVKIIRVIQK